MGPITLLFHASVARLRALWLDDLFREGSLGPPPGLLLISGRAASLGSIRRAWAGDREQAVFLPEIVSLDSYISGLAFKHGQGFAPLPPKAHASLAQELLLQEPSPWPWLGSLRSRTPLGPQLAGLHTLVAESRGDSLELMGARRGAELDRFLKALNDRVEHLADHRLEASLLKHLLRQLTAPGPVLQRALRKHALVVLMDLVDLSPLRQSLLLAILQCWYQADVRVVVCLPCGHPADLWEFEAFFGTEGNTSAAERTRSLATSKVLRRALFEGFVTTGQAQLRLCTKTGILAVDETEPALQEPEDLVDHAATGRPLPEGHDLPPGLELRRCPDEKVEITTAIRDVKRLLLRGVRPEDCLIALADLGERRPLLLATARDHGIVLSSLKGSPLSATAVGALILRALELVFGSQDIQDLLLFLESDLVSSPLPLQPRRMKRLARAAGMQGGSPETWRTSLETHLHRLALDARVPIEKAETNRLRALAELDALLSFKADLLPLREPTTPDEYRARLLRFAQTLCIPSRVGRLDRRMQGGNPGQDLARRVSSEGLLAWGQIQEIFEEFVISASAARRGPWPASEMAAMIRQLLEEQTLHTDRGSLGAVRILDTQELPAILPPHTWLLGLSQGFFPARASETFLVEITCLSRLSPNDPSSSTRSLLSRLLRECLDDPSLSLVLSWPATRGGRLSPVSPILNEILSLETDGQPPRRRIEQEIKSPRVELADPLSATDMARLSTLGADWSAVLPEPVRSGWTLRRECCDSRRDTFAFGHWDAVLDIEMELPRPLPLTLLERFLRCPIAFYFGHHLRLWEETAYDPELPPQRRGVVLHKVLERFLVAREGHKLEGLDPAGLTAARSLLADLLDEAAREEQERFSAHPDLLGWQISRWGSGLRDDSPKGLLAVWLQAESDRAWGARPLVTEMRFHDTLAGRVQLSGQIDRVDRLDDGSIVVIDYKTGLAPSPAQLRTGLALQPILYALAASKRLAREMPFAAVYQELRGATGLKYRTWHGDPELVARCASPQEARKALTPQETNAVIEHASRALERMSRGCFHPTLADPSEAGCSYCPFLRICRLDEPRAQEIRESGGDWQAPLQAPKGDET